MMNRLIEQFPKTLKNLGISLENHVYLALSSGLDSVVLLDLFAQFGFIGTIAHVNYGLRGEDSIEDEALAHKLALHYRWKIEVLSADNEISEHPGESTQIAARRIRYDWFNLLLERNSSSVLALAHHANDQAETFFIKLLRGGGVESLSGMDEQNRKFIRPLLKYSKEDLLAYATEKELVWREDRSNQSDVYLRNAIRHHIIPSMIHVQPNSLRMMNESITRLKSEEKQLRFFTQAWIKDHVNYLHSGFSIKKTDLVNMPSPTFLLHELLKDYGFSWRFCESISSNLTNTHTQYFSAGKNVIVLDRLNLSLNQHVAAVSEDETAITPTISIEYHSTMPENIGIQTKNEAWFSVNKIQGKLLLRKWQKGDRYWPWGMNGSKLLSDYFTDLKLQPEEKENQWILTCDNEIVWVVNLRIDRRFAADPGEKDLVCIRVSE